MKVLLVITTVDSQEEAEKLAETIVKERLGACVQIIGPIKSIYEWKGKIENAEEWILFIKTLEPNYSSLESRLKELHPYEVPEIIAIPVSSGLKDYLSWIKEVVKS